MVSAAAMDLVALDKNLPPSRRLLAGMLVRDLRPAIAKSPLLEAGAI